MKRLLSRSAPLAKTVVRVTVDAHGPIGLAAVACSAGACRSRRESRFDSFQPAHVVSTWRALVLLGGLPAVEARAGKAPSPPPTFPDRPIAYLNHRVAEGPWSVHIVRLARRLPGFGFETTLGQGTHLGMGTVSDQLKARPARLGRPVAAVNGDFYDSVRGVPGRPRDLQIRHGELVSAPAGHACFWLTADGTPHATNVSSRFRIVWPSGASTPVGLNQDRADDALVLYSGVAASRTPGGREFVLEGVPTRSWLPLRVGQTHVGRVRGSPPADGSAMAPDTLVLSIGPRAAGNLPSIEPGTTPVQIVTETMPPLSEVDTAVAGGPMLVHRGRPMQWNGLIQPRHPRSALGWNADHFFLVQVDGRQEDLSVGMTLQEFADYLARLGCQEAINFDGGGSATLWAFGNVQNSPSEGQERPCPNALVIVKRNDGP